MNPKPRRGEIWTAYLHDAPKKHWVVIVSLDSRNLSDRASSVLVIPFGSTGAESPTTMLLKSGETGLPQDSYLKAHFIQVAAKAALLEKQSRMLTDRRLRQVVAMVNRAIDPEAPWIA